MLVSVFRGFSVVLLGSLGGLFTYAVFHYRDFLDLVFFGRAGSIYKRFDETIGTVSSGTGISALSFDYATKSSGAVSLDFFSIILGNFGYIYLVAAVLFFAFTTLKLKVDLSKKSLFVTVILLGFISNGSILIPQYTILFIFVFYVNSVGILGKK